MSMLSEMAAFRGTLGMVTLSIMCQYAQCRMLTVIATFFKEIAVQQHSGSSAITMSAVAPFLKGTVGITTPSIWCYYAECQFSVAFIIKCTIGSA